MEGKDSRREIINAQHFIFTYKKLNFIYHREMGGTPGQRVTKVLMFGMENLCFFTMWVNRPFVYKERE